MVKEVLKWLTENVLNVVQKSKGMFQNVRYVLVYLTMILTKYFLMMYSLMMIGKENPVVSVRLIPMQV